MAIAPFTFASAGEGQLSRGRAGSQSDAVSACCPGPPRLSQCLTCCQRAALVLTGEGWKVLWTGVAALCVDSAPGPDGSVSCCESLVPSCMPSWVEIHVRAAFGDLELILCLLDTSELCWLENKARSHNPKS